MRCLLLAVAVASAAACHGSTAFTLGFDKVSDARAGTPGTWAFSNYSNRLSLSVVEVDGEKCAELKLNRKDCDTQFSLRRGERPSSGRWKSRRSAAGLAATSMPSSA